MPRHRRQWQPQLFYHVVMRGNNRQNIFNDTLDYREFFRALAYVYDKHPFTIIGYCIMNNHYHLLIRSPEVPLSKIMMLLNKRYTEYFKKKNNYHGHLYEKRYFSEEVNTTKGLLEVSRYIHRNPIETKTPMVANIEDYPYSSYQYYKSNLKSPYAFLDTAQLPTYFKLPAQQTTEYLCHFTEQEALKTVPGTETNEIEVVTVQTIQQLCDYLNGQL